MKEILVAFLLIASPALATDIIITIPTAIAPRVLDGFAANHGYRATLEDGSPNPESKAEFARRMLKEYIRQSAIAGETLAARDAAEASQRQQSETDFAF